MRLISIHVAKAGGTSVYGALQTAYGPNLLVDYRDDPANPLSPRNIDPNRYFGRAQTIPDNVECVHGHFHPAKFRYTESDFLFTLLRHPVDNLISIYFFWRQMARQGAPLHDYFLDNELNLLDTARLPLLRRLFCGTYFGGFDMARFNLIGRHEDRAPALQTLSRETGRFIDHRLRANQTPQTDERAETSADPKLRRKLTDILADDIDFYERWTQEGQVSPRETSDNRRRNFDNPVR